MRTRLSLAALLVVGAACTYTFGVARLPREGGPWTVPLVDPLTAERLQVEVELVVVRDGAERRTRVLSLLDTGAHRSSLPRSVLKDLGIEGSAAPDLQHTDVAGHDEPWVGARFDAIRVGSLELRDAPMGVNGPADERGLVGDEILSQTSLEIDPDAGVAILGGPELPSAAVVPLGSGDHAGDLPVEAVLDGRPVLLDLDTGAGAALDVDTGNDLGLRVMGTPRQTGRGIWGEYRSKGLFRVETLGLGSKTLHRLSFDPIPDFRRGGLFNRKRVGLLGTRVLEHFHYRIDQPHGRLQLSPRRGLVAGAARRIARWGTRFPQCEETPGCLQASLDGRDDRVLLKLKAVRAYAGAAKILVALTDGEGALVPGAPAYQIVFDRLPAGELLPIGLGQPTGPLAKATGVAVLDVNPARASELPDARRHQQVSAWRVAPLLDPGARAGGD